MEASLVENFILAKFQFEIRKYGFAENLGSWRENSPKTQYLSRNKLVARILFDVLSILWALSMSKIWAQTEVSVAQVPSWERFADTWVEIKNSKQAWWGESCMFLLLSVNCTYELERRILFENVPLIVLLQHKLIWTSRFSFVTNNQI